MGGGRRREDGEDLVLRRIASRQRESKKGKKGKRVGGKARGFGVANKRENNFNSLRSMRYDFSVDLTGIMELRGTMQGLVSTTNGNYPGNDSMEGRDFIRDGVLGGRIGNWPKLNWQRYLEIAVSPLPYPIQETRNNPLMREGVWTLIDDEVNPDNYPTE